MKRKEERLPIFKERFRELQGEMSNTEFAAFLGMSRQTVGFYCNGDRIPDAVGLKEIAEKCNVSADWLLGLTDDKCKNPSPIDKLGLNEGSLQVLERLTKQLHGEYESAKRKTAIKEAGFTRRRLNERMVGRLDDAEYRKMLDITGTTTKAELVEELVRKDLDEELDFFRCVEQFDAELVLNILNLLLEKEDELCVLRNLALYIFTGHSRFAGKDNYMVVGPEKSELLTEATFNPSSLANIFLLEAENAIRKMKETEEKYQIFELQV